MDALFLDHYERELAYLRELGGEFALKYPKLAGRLGFDDFLCSDPFVERLLEGFAFMSARVQRRLDAEFPQLTRALFDAVFPHYGRPIPSTGIFQVNPAHDEGSLVEGYTVPKGTRLHARAAQGEQTGCRYDTVADVQLWPLRVARAEFFSRERTTSFNVPEAFHDAAVRCGLLLTFETTAAIPINLLKLDRLLLHLRGGEIAQQVYEMMLAHKNSLSIADRLDNREQPSVQWRPLKLEQLQPYGLEADQGLFPSDPRSFSGYRLLHEYFLLPEKFMFVEVVDLQRSLQTCTDKQFHLLIGMDQIPTNLIGRVSAEHFALHCVPAVNLFRRRADRVFLDHSQSEHQIIADRSRPLDFEIWSIEELAGHTTASKQEIPVLPMYAPTAESADAHNAMYYAIERRQRLVSENSRNDNRAAYLGNEVFVALTDSHADPRREYVQQLSSTLYCTNRDLPLVVPDGGWRTAFAAETAGPIANTLCLTGPTPPKPSLVTDDGEAAWRFISHLTPNYLSLTDSARGGAAMLRELLTLYCTPDDHSALRQVQGVRSIGQQPIVRRVPVPGPLVYARGIEIEVVCDEDAFEGGGAFLLGTILDQFFARYVTINSFTETHLTSTRRGTIHRWPVRMGLGQLL